MTEAHMYKQGYYKHVSELYVTESQKPGIVLYLPGKKERKWVNPEESLNEWMNRMRFICARC